MKPEIHIVRFSGSNKGSMSFIMRDEKMGVIEVESIRDVEILTGSNSKSDPKFDWVKGGGGGIPPGDFWLWTDVKINKGQPVNPIKAGDVGYYSFSISSDKKLKHLLYSKFGERGYIEYHDDNTFPGSVGCPVSISHTDFILSMKWIVNLKDPWKHIPVFSRRK